MTLRLQKTTVMVVDDDEFIQKLLDDVLNAEGYGVLLSGSAEEAQKTLQRVTPDLFVVDIMLPGIDGLQFCQVIRANPIISHRPILILSSKHSVKDRVLGLNSGADDYLVKPFHLDELVARIQALLRRSAAPVETVSQPVAVESTQVLQTVKPVVPPGSISTIHESPIDRLTEKKKLANDYFKERMYEEALQVWEELNHDFPKDVESKKFIEITRTQLMRKYLDVLGSKDAIPLRTSDRPEDFIGLDFNTQEGFIFSRIDGKTDIKGIVAISGVKPLRAYGIMFNFFKSGVIRLKKK